MSVRDCRRGLLRDLRVAAEVSGDPEYASILLPSGDSLVYEVEPSGRAEVYRESGWRTHGLLGNDADVPCVICP